MHAFADESVRRDSYLICATAIAVPNLVSTRTALRCMRASGQRRIHFVSESDRRRRTILARMSDLETTTVIYVAHSRNQVKSRTAIVQIMVPDLRGRGVSRLVLDSRDGQDNHDRSAIYHSLRIGRGPHFSYAHQRSAEEPLLWIPDAIAWAWGRGGEWRKRVQAHGLIKELIRVAAP